ncbi:hypothetical protein TWF696_005569 [Orbilia brochopaga]|uniref:Uncharacterized protein n=1 Tax=Orbilia brochopaga TaxID=3140254 RepID=A0AAV9V169_9PEZI
MHFKPTQRKNGAIVLAIHGPVNPTTDAPAPDVEQAGVDEQQEDQQYSGKKQRKRPHSTFSPAAAPAVPAATATAKGKAGRKSKKH